MGVISGRVGGERGEEEEVDDGDDDNRGRREGGGIGEDWDSREKGYWEVRSYCERNESAEIQVV